MTVVELQSTPPAASANGQADVSMQPLLVSGAAAAALLGLSPRTFRRLDAGGQVPRAIRVGASTKRWRVADLRCWVALGCPGRHRWEALRASK